MLYIVGFWHLFGYTDMINRMPFGEYIKNATLATFVFISGYLLGMRYVINSYTTFLLFFQRRIIRILPLFSLALFSYLIVRFISLRTALISLTGLSTFIAPQPPTLWFVSMILIFYYFFTLISGKRIHIQILIVSFIFIVVFVADVFFLEIDRRFFYYWPCFALGVILARFELTNYLKSWGVILAGLVLFVGISIAHLHDIGSAPQWLYRVLISITGTCLILCISQMISGIRAIAKSSIIISYLSMSAYLFHRQIVDIIEKFIFWPEEGWFRVIYLVFFCLPVVLLLGYAIQKLYDIIVDKIIHKHTIART